ncbi:lysozyme inhibitor LprI family protein [Oceanicola sp. 22II-s10i]|uniref:lysozyme inhibitor LprI family protein n=1 Tax=Oceanicola sp. 22II-s10i TaxID=1317116 RepID=UPI000B5289D1|nr:lysozyme inhibitor LprI family protein [Oceanicola sp. 22II-s10i]
MSLSRALPFALGLALLAPPAMAASPSFDCTKAGTPTEYAICDNDELARLDVALAEAYARARARGEPGLRDRQRAWIKERDRCGANVACLAGSMRQRLAELGAPVPGQGTPPGGGVQPPPGGGIQPPPGGGIQPPPGGGIQPPGFNPQPPGGGIQPPGGSFPVFPGGSLQSGGQSAPGAFGLTGLYCVGSAALAFRDEGDRATFNVALFLENGHACGTPDLSATFENGGWTARDGACTLRVARTDTGLSLSAEPMLDCRQLYCGARAMIPDLEFPYGSRAPAVADPLAWNFMEQGCG